jgi:toxin-antitoxin system PIN domain toxin
VTILGFVRITTNRKIVLRPLAVGNVLDRISSWLELPHVHVPQPSERHFEKLRETLLRLGTAGNLTTDAHLATLAIERGYVLYSTDADFSRFAGLRWVNPCAAA